MQDNSYIVDKLFDQIKDNHILEKHYFRPIELLLRKLPPSDRTTPLPQGLLIAQKNTSINDVGYNKIRLEHDSERPQTNISKKYRKNLISLLKRANTPSQNQRTEAQNRMVSYIRERKSDKRPLNFPTQFEIAICVCVYSEDAQMLQQTLSYIKQNVISLVKNGVRQDSIGVFVFFDGIQKIDPSVIEFFTKMQNQDVNYKEDVDIYSAPAQFRNASNQARNTYERRAQVRRNVFDRYLPRIIFSQEELRDRQERTMSEVYNSYMEMVNLKDTIKKLKGQPNLSYERLPERVREEFMALARKLEQYDGEETEVILFDLMYRNKQRQRTLFEQALTNTEAHCNKYISSKNDLIYLSMRREQIYGKVQIERQFERFIFNRSSRVPTIIRFTQQQRRHFQPQPSQDQIHDQSQDQYADRRIHLNIFFCVKYKNEGKLSSHNWFFNGFCKELHPKYVILVDVGLKARANSIFAMYNHLKKNSNLGGVCGYMSLKIEQTGSQDEVNEEEVDCLTDIAHSFISIQRAQQVEYHFAHLLDKPFESLFNFIHVLPGAFSGYNMLAIYSPQDQKEEILHKYFESLDEKAEQKPIIETKITLGWLATKVLLPDFIASCFVSVNPNSQEQLLCNENMNLAEDRILCFGIHKNGYDLAYLPDSYSEVDPIKNLHSLFGQRKRWINGSYFAFEKVKEEFSQFQKKNDKTEFCLWLQMLYLSLVNMVSFFSVSLFLFTFQISMRAFYEDVLKPIFQKTFVTNQVIPFFINTMTFIYVFFILTVIYYSLNLTYNHKKFKKLLYLSSTIMGIFSIVITVVLLVDLCRVDWQANPFIQVNGIDENSAASQSKLAFILRIIIVCMFGLHALPIIIHSIFYKKFQIMVEVVLGVISFLFYNPTYLIILNIYALCRMDDISWGTKGRDQQQKFKQTLKRKWRIIKFTHVFKYLFWNTALSLLFLNIQFEYQARIYVTMMIMSIITFILFVKMLLGLIYTIRYKTCLAQKIRVQTLVDLFQFQSQISQTIDRQRLTLLTKATIATNVTSLINQSQEERRIGQTN